jgi:hypothetical protein
MNHVYYTMPDAARILGEKYNRVRWAILSRVVDPAQQYGRRYRVRLFTVGQIETLKEYFSKGAAR